MRTIVFSVVVGNFYVTGALFSPSETYSVLFIDADTELTISISGQCFQSITRRHSQFIDTLHRVKLIKLPCSNAPQILGTRLSDFPGIDAIEQVLTGFVRERFNHRSMIARTPCYSSFNMPRARLTTKPSQKPWYATVDLSRALPTPGSTREADFIVVCSAPTQATSTASRE